MRNQVSRCLTLRDEEAPPGISAVIVYPMNALAEDQLMRLRGMLAGTGIPFGICVGKTPERETNIAFLRDYIFTGKQPGGGEAGESNHWWPSLEEAHCGKRAV